MNRNHESTINTNNRKRMNTTLDSAPEPKRLRCVDNDERTGDTIQTDFSEIIDYIKEICGSIKLLKRHHEHSRVATSRQEKFLKLLYTNQRKIAKSLTKKKVRDDDFSTCYFLNLFLDTGFFVKRRNCDEECC